MDVTDFYGNMQTHSASMFGFITVSRSTGGEELGRRHAAVVLDDGA